MLRRLGYALRRHFSLFDDRLNGPTYLLVEVRPLLCSPEELLGKCATWMTEKAAPLWRGDETLEVRPGQDRLCLGSTRTRRLALAVTEFDSIWIDLHVPTGVRSADGGDFDALVASIRSVRRPHTAYRRGVLLRNSGTPQRFPTAPTCSLDDAERVRRMAVEFDLATREDPNDWRPWVELAELRLEPHPWYDFTTQMDHGRLGVQTSDVWYAVSAGPGKARRDSAQLRHVAWLYGQAALRAPPALDGWPGGDLRAQDLAGVLAWQARHLAEAGDVDDAARVYQRALDEGSLGSWGVLEASLWLGERAYQEGDRRRALEIYSHAKKAWRAYFPGLRSLDDPAETYLVIATRLRELEADESLRLPR